MTSVDTETLLTAWSAALAADDRSPHTIRAYLRAVRAFVDWYAEERHEPFAPADLTPIDLIGYRQHLQRRQQAAASINQQLAALRAFSAWLVEQRYRVDDPARRLKQVAIQAQRAPRSLQPREVHALLRAAQQSGEAARDYAIVQVLVQTGIRLSECAALRIGDIQISERMGQMIVRAGKGNKQRTVPANASVRQALADYLGSRWGVAPTVKAVVAAWPERPPTEPVWVGQRGMLTSRSIGRIIEELVSSCARHGLVPEETSAHTLRHTFATSYLLDHPGDLVGLATLLGHSTLETTRIYVQPSDDDLARRVEVLRLNAYE